MLISVEIIGMGSIMIEVSMSTGAVKTLSEHTKSGHA
jgi:hypothetical protein